MRNINEILTELNPELLSEISNSFRSIFKLDRASSEFLDLSRNISEIKNAHYIVNSNLNNSKGSIFLDSKGNIVFEADFFANLLPNIDLDFILNIPDYTINHPLKEIINSEFNF